MKSALLVTMLITGACIFTACPYESEIPIDDPNVKTNASLFGEWKIVDDDNSQHYFISGKDEFTYLIKEVNSGTGESSSYHAHASAVKGTTFINLYDADPEAKRTYSFYKLTTTSNDAFTLSEVTENIDEKFSSGKELQKFIASNMGKSFFFSKEELRFARVAY